jgi:hypothetical protein
VVTDYQRMLDAKLQQMNRLRVNPEYVMPVGMLDNWRRRLKRLDRAKIRATQDNRVQHLDRINAARQRLITGRLHS